MKYRIIEEEWYPVLELIPDENGPISLTPEESAEIDRVLASFNITQQQLRELQDAAWARAVAHLPPGVNVCTIHRFKFQSPEERTPS